MTSRCPRDGTGRLRPATAPAPGKAAPLMMRTTRNWPPTTPTWPGSPPRRVSTESGTGSAEAAPGQLRRQAGARSRAPLPGDGLRARRGADHPVLCRHPAADRRASRGRQRCRRAARDSLHHLPGLRLAAGPAAPPGLRADGADAAGRDHPDPHLRRGTLGDPPLHRAGPGRAGHSPAGDGEAPEPVSKEQVAPELVSKEQVTPDEAGPDRAGPDHAGPEQVRPEQAAQHYFTASPAAAHRPGLVQVVLPDLHFECVTDAGVFSPGRLDPGSRVLLETVPPPPARGDLLDLGTGYGPIALAMAARAPEATVWAVDINERALGLCAANAARAGLGNVRC